MKLSMELLSADENSNIDIGAIWVLLFLLLLLLLLLTIEKNLSWAINIYKQYSANITKNAKVLKRILSFFCEPTVYPVGISV